MNLAFQSLLMLLLLVCGAVVVLPYWLFRPDPSLSPPLRLGLKQPGIWVVESGKDQWFVNGALHAKADLAALLKEQSQKQLVHYLPSDALPLQRVTTSVQWLRSLAPNAVVLELPPQRFSP
ncbi:MAG: hypothetical protein ACKO28_09190 [Cyanobium sp.]